MRNEDESDENWIRSSAHLKDLKDLIVSSFERFEIFDCLLIWKSSFLVLSQPLMECLGLSQQRSDFDDDDCAVNDNGDDDVYEEDDSRALNGMCWREATPTLMLLIHWSITAIACHTRWTGELHLNISNPKEKVLTKTFFWKASLTLDQSGNRCWCLGCITWCFFLSASN